MVLCFIKMVCCSVLKKVHQGILLEYISEIFLNYFKTWVFYLDLIYLILSWFLLFEMMRDSHMHRIQKVSAYMFVCSTIRIFGSVDNLTTFRNTFITGLNMDQFYKLLKLSVYYLILIHLVAMILLAMCFIDDK